MERFACALAAMLTTGSAHVYAQPSNAVPGAPAAPAATIQAPTHVVPRPASGIEAGDVGTLLETGAEGTANAAGAAARRGVPGARALRTAADIVKIPLGPINTVADAYDFGSSLYRGAQCAQNGDQANADQAMGEATYTALGMLNPLVGVAQACAHVIGHLTVGNDFVKDLVVSSMIANMEKEREMNAQGFDVPPHVWAYGESPYHYWTPPGSANDRARRNAAFQSALQANEQSAANRVATAPEPSPWSDPQVTQMMWMLMPAAIAASQQRAAQQAIRPPMASAPSAPQSPPVRCLEGQTYEYDANGRAQPCPNYPDHLRQVYGPPRVPLGSTFGTPGGASDVRQCTGPGCRSTEQGPGCRGVC